MISFFHKNKLIVARSTLYRIKMMMDWILLASMVFTFMFTRPVDTLAKRKMGNPLALTLSMVSGTSRL